MTRRRKRLDESNVGQHGEEDPESQRTGKRKRSMTSDENQEGRYRFRIGQNITPRYKILRALGKGTFGQVLECWDRESQENVAIKVTRSISRYRKAAELEINVLRLLAKYDTTGIQGCLRLKHWFNHKGHICIVCERLGPSLCNVLSWNCFRPIPLHQVCKIGKQILSSLKYVHEKCYVIHTDLKPENILTVSTECTEVVDLTLDRPDSLWLPKSSKVRIIDFGSARFGPDQSSIVTTREYRAPEVILGLGWSYPCDIWSVGCTLIELVSGKILFQPQPEDDFVHLAMMERVLGPIPSSMRNSASEGCQKYFGCRELCWPELVEGGQYPAKTIQAVESLPPLKNLIQTCASSSVVEDFTDLLQGMLTYNPDARLTAAEALSHAFFTDYPSLLKNP